MQLPDPSPIRDGDTDRMAATLMGELGTDPHVIEVALGHVTLHTGLASVYNRARYRPQVAAALAAACRRARGDRERRHRGHSSGPFGSLGIG